MDTAVGIHITQYTPFAANTRTERRRVRANIVALNLCTVTAFYHAIILANSKQGAEFRNVAHDVAGFRVIISPKTQEFVPHADCISPWKGIHAVYFCPACSRSYEQLPDVLRRESNTKAEIEKS